VQRFEYKAIQLKKALLGTCSILPLNRKCREIEEMKGSSSNNCSWREMQQIAALGLLASNQQVALSGLDSLHCALLLLLHDGWRLTNL